MTDEEMILRLKKIRKNYSGKDDEALTWAMECIRFKRPHGEWKEKHCDYGVYYRCSNCHKMPPNYECDYKEGAIKTNFCPNCGADMRKEG